MAAPVTRNQDRATRKALSQRRNRAMAIGLGLVVGAVFTTAVVLTLLFHYIEIHHGHAIF